MRKSGFREALSFIAELVTESELKSGFESILCLFHHFMLRARSGRTGIFHFRCPRKASGLGPTRNTEPHWCVHSKSPGCFSTHPEVKTGGYSSQPLFQGTRTSLRLGWAWRVLHTKLKQESSKTEETQNKTWPGGYISTWPSTKRGFKPFLKKTEASHCGTEDSTCKESQNRVDFRNWLHWFSQQIPIQLTCNFLKTILRKTAMMC